MRSVMARRLRVIIGLALLAVAPGVTRAQFTVTSTDDAADAAPGDGICAVEAGGCTLRAALQENEALGGGYTIDFGVAGTITLGQGALSITRPVSIAGPGANVLSVSGGGASRVFSISSATADPVMISGLTIRDGRATDDPTKRFKAGGGGLVVFGGAKVTLATCAVRNNTASASANKFAVGGGIYVVRPNQAEGPETVVVVDRCELSGNAAAGGVNGYGGGVYNSSAHVQLLNATVAQNTATSGFGGGLAVDGAGVWDITAVTIAGNDGSGIDLFDNVAVSLRNTIVAGNTGDQCTLLDVPGTSGTPALTSRGYNLSTDASCNLDHPTDQPSTPVVLGALADNGGTTQTIALQDGSAAIDSGTCEGITADQRDYLRPTGGTCDIGAYEHASVLPVELISFEGRTSGRDVMLYWETASETNNAGFQIQQSAAGAADEAWLDLGFVEGRGTTAEQQRYGFQVHGLEAGSFRFRLKQIDYDGTFDYSPVVEVLIEVPAEARLMPAYPNPFNPSTEIGFSVPVDGRAEVLVFDGLGREVRSLFAGEARGGTHYRLDFDAAGMPSGVYFSVLRFNGRVRTEKMLLVK